MALELESLRAALAALPPPVGDLIADGKVLAARLCAFIEEDRAESEIVELHHWAFNVEFVLRNGDYWAIECLSPNAFHMYPGFVRGDTVTWPNIWVADDMSLEELVRDINGVAFRTTKEEFGNA